MCYLSSYSWPSKCQIQVPHSSLECSHHMICTGVSLAPCFWLLLCQIPSSHNVLKFVSGAGRLPGQCACHNLLVAVRIWRTLMSYQVLPSAVCHTQTGRIQWRNLSRSLYTGCWNQQLCVLDTCVNIFLGLRFSLCSHALAK